MPVPDPKKSMEESEALPVEDRDKGFYASKIQYSRKPEQLTEEERKKRKPKSLLERLKEKMGLAELQAEAVEK